jgi:hypothetical protein
MSLSPRFVDWAPVREAFVQRPTRPTYTELSTEFAIAQGVIGRTAADEGWPALRAQYLDGQLAKCDASAVLLEAVKVDRSLINQFTSVAISALSKLAQTIESIEDDRAPATKADALNTCSFAYVNLAKGLREVGVIGVSKSLDGAGKGDNGRWNPGLLQQINVNISELAMKARESQVVLTQAERNTVPVEIPRVEQRVTPVPSESAPIPKVSDSASV